MNVLDDLLHEYRRHKRLADQALAQLDEASFLRRPAAHTNPVALIVKHLAGNLQSRWTDFLTTEGEKPGRSRDQEFILTTGDTRAGLLASWERGWAALFATITNLTAADLDKTVTIRGETHTVYQAL